MGSMLNMVNDNNSQTCFVVLMFLFSIMFLKLIG
jgi:hypothetical protein